MEFPCSPCYCVASRMLFSNSKTISVQLLGRESQIVIPSPTDTVDAHSDIISVAQPQDPKRSNAFQTSRECCLYCFIHSVFKIHLVSTTWILLRLNIFLKERLLLAGFPPRTASVEKVVWKEIQLEVFGPISAHDKIDVLTNLLPSSPTDWGLDAFQSRGI